LLAHNSPRLKHLNIKEGKLEYGNQLTFILGNIGDGELYYILKRLTTLESLSLESASKFTPKGLRKIAKYATELRKLEIRFGKVDNSVVSSISWLLLMVFRSQLLARNAQNLRS
jgi:hypothetical protein